MKAARIALRSAAPLAGAGAGSSRLPLEVEQFSRFSPSPLSIKQLLDFGESREDGGRSGLGAAQAWARRPVSPRRGGPGGCRGRGAERRPARHGRWRSRPRWEPAGPGGGGGGTVGWGRCPLPQFPAGQVPGAGDLWVPPSALKIRCNTVSAVSVGCGH